MLRERRLDTGLLGLGDGLALVAGVVLAVSSFTGWYTGEGEGVTISVLGWNTGVLGTLVLFVGLAVVLVLVLREVGVEPPAAVPQSLLTVALGALATIFVLVRVISVPDDFFFANRGVGIWISAAGRREARTQERPYRWIWTRTRTPHYDDPALPWGHGVCFRPTLLGATAPPAAAARAS